MTKEKDLEEKLFDLTTAKDEIIPNIIASIEAFYDGILKMASHQDEGTAEFSITRWPKAYFWFVRHREDNKDTSYSMWYIDGKEGALHCKIYSDENGRWENYEVFNVKKAKKK